MKILAIESSCDETAAAVTEERQVISSVIASQVDEHVLYGGVVPEIASRRHTENISAVVQKALEDAGCTLADIEAVAVTYAPGLIGALLVGVNFAKGLCLSGGLPLVPVHHLRGHIAANYITDHNLKPPFLCLVVSGGHSHLVEVRDYTDFSVIGRTLDDAAGECFDPDCIEFFHNMDASGEADEAALISGKKGDDDLMVAPYFIKLIFDDPQTKVMQGMVAGSEMKRTTVKIGLTFEVQALSGKIITSGNVKKEKSERETSMGGVDEKSLVIDAIDEAL